MMTRRTHVMLVGKQGHGQRVQTSNHKYARRIPAICVR